jgi:hypothetical protein
MPSLSSINGDLRLQVRANPGLLAEKVLRGKVYDEFIDGLLEIAQELQEKSYVGATGKLKSSWDVTQPRRESVTFEIRASIVNASDRAINRIAGRGSGLMPPDAPIRDWVRAKGIPESKVYPIRKAIALKGTLRFRSKENFAGLNPDGSLQPQGFLAIAEKKLAARLSNLNKS